MLSAAQVAEFDRQGYLNAGLVLSESEVDELCVELEAVIAGRTARPPVSLRNLSGRDDSPVWQVVNIWEASEAYARLVHHPTVVGMVSQLIPAEAIRLWHDQIQYKPPRDGGTNMWHQDGPLWSVLGATSMVTAWIALDEVDTANGCMSLVPGSHRWGDQMDYLRTVPSFEALGVGCERELPAPELWPVRRGELSFHHCLTWHGSHGNLSERPRRAIALHYMDAATPYVAAGNHLLKPYITAADGEPVVGERFPLVYQEGRLVPA